MQTLVLDVGYTDSQSNLHREVEIGNRLLGKDLFEIDEHPLAQLKTNREGLMLSRAITKFGGIKMPVPLAVLQSLDSIDRDDLLDAFNQQESEGAEGRTAAVLSDSTLRLRDGIEVEGVVYDIVEFGNRLTAKHYLEADMQELDGLRRVFYLVGAQVSRLSQSEGQATLEGTLNLETMEVMHVSDLYALRGASEVWRQSFRRTGSAVRQERNGAGGVRADGGDGQE